MGKANVALGDPLVLSLQIEKGDTDKYVRAHVTDENNVSLPGSPFTLQHQANGRYVFKDEDNLKFPAGVLEVHATYIVYDDSGFTTEAEFKGRGFDVWFLDSQSQITQEIQEILEMLEDILQTVQSFSASAEITGIIDTQDDIVGNVEMSEITGMVTEDEITGVLSSIELFGTVSDGELIGIVEGS